MGENRDSDSISLREHKYGVRLSVLEERARCERIALKVRTKYLERRLSDLNGEAARLKTAADLSVTREKFDDFVNTSRAQFEAYRTTQNSAFKAYADEIEKKLSSINMKLATWGGALIVAVAVLQFVLRKI